MCEKSPHPFFISQERLEALNKEELARIKSKTTENAIDILASDCFEKIIKILNVRPGEIFGIDVSSIMPPGVKVVMSGCHKGDSNFYDCDSIKMAFYTTSIKGDDSVLHKSYFIDDKIDKLSYLLTIYLKLSKSEMSADCIKSSLRKYMVRDTRECTLYHGDAPIYTIDGDIAHCFICVEVNSDSNELIICIDRANIRKYKPNVCCISIATLPGGVTDTTYEFLTPNDVQAKKLKNTAHLMCFNIGEYADYVRYGNKNKMNLISCKEKMLSGLRLSLKFKNSYGGTDNFDDILEAVK